MYQIEIVEGALEEIGSLRPYDGRRILDEIEEQLTHDPSVPTRRRKVLVGLVPPFAAMLPVWELRVGEYRVFYDVDEAARKVFVRAVRRKPPHRTLEESL